MSQIDKDLNDALSGMIRGIGRLFYLAGRGGQKIKPASEYNLIFSNNNHSCFILFQS